MSIDIYVAQLVVQPGGSTHVEPFFEREYSDNTMNLANRSFFSLAEDLGVSDIMKDYCGTMDVRTLKNILKTSIKTPYHPRLETIIATAERAGARTIAWS